MVNTTLVASEAQEAKDLLEKLTTFNEKINFIRTLRQSWNFETDREENTESFKFVADDNSQLVLAINDSSKTVTCEV